MMLHSARKKEKLFVYTDGGSRGNPGPAAVGIVVKDAGGKILKTHAVSIGERTNNEAEYEAVLIALKKLKQWFGKAKLAAYAIEFRMDSELVVRQLRGEYKVSEERLFGLFMAIHNFQVEFGSLEFVHVPRERNREADHLLNTVLNAARPERLW